MEDIVIVGHGGFARETAWIIDRINSISPTWNFMGYIENKDRCEDVVGDDSYIIRYPQKLAVIVAIGETKIRQKIVNSYTNNLNLYYPNIIDPSVVISNGVKMGLGNIICAGTVITVDIKIGDFNIINLNCTVGHDVCIGNYVTINPNVNISGACNIGDESNIGTGTQLIQGRSVGQDTIIGAGSVIINDIESNCVAVGVPAKPIKMVGK